MGVTTLIKYPKNLEVELNKLFELLKNAINPNVSLEELKNINNQCFNNDKDVKNAITFVDNFYGENFITGPKIRDDGESLVLNQHVGVVAKETLLCVENYGWDKERQKNIFIPALTHDLLEDFPFIDSFFRTTFGEDVYKTVSAVTIPYKKYLTKKQLNKKKKKFLTDLVGIPYDEPKIIKIKDYDNNIECYLSLLNRLADGISKKLINGDNTYTEDIKLYKKRQNKILLYIKYLDYYINIAKKLPKGLDKEIKGHVNTLDESRRLFNKIFINNTNPLEYFKNLGAYIKEHKLNYHSLKTA